MAERIRIEALGARGDGVGPGPTFVPYTLPGETALVERDGARARLVAVEDPSPSRIEPFCPYFFQCGGCVTQHIASDTYAAWKHGLVVDTLRRAGIEAEVAPLVDAHGDGRRRLTFHARQTPEGMAVGFMALRTHDLVSITHCPIATPALLPSPALALAVARRLARSKKPLDIGVTATDGGLDMDVRGHGPANPSLRQSLVAAANELDLARLSIHGDIVVERRPPTVPMGRATLVLPPGGFLQATRLGEETLAGLVVEACSGAKRVADLFAGCGPFALRLAERAEVLAVEQDKPALQALDRAARSTPGLRRVMIEPRDLFRRPLLPLELDRFDAVVMDPPRAGAEAQARQLAASKVPVVASVSCDAGTFARDAGILIAGGYRLERVTPVDQFRHSPHVELVGLFRRPKSRR
ncbi:class I SAM-dependent RNA methyltransferase [Salinarimonas soli]|uniref:Class I SAM-dependent RNA methyltransferase n=1 Tax=Salinarimonas soli TaxID=1638099 RepID=A0A5B2VAX2_9HYPH|nr:class I SAM-dependent RNA methyltransferase [Salinarimonas soli]KAA2235519.1 class I SAM-dependent RNA methyltransferase [Salinarimonas soli]